jgi:N-formylglutamate deformylase
VRSDAEWLHIEPGSTPLLLSIPHAGTNLRGLEHRFVSPWLARKDADWHVRQLYSFARELDATIVSTDICRTVIDVNRDPSGRSLYPGQATTDLCPRTTFDGEPLYRADTPLDAHDVGERRVRYFDPYHAALKREIQRLLDRHAYIVLYDCHSIRSSVPRLFDGVLPQFNIGTNDGESCRTELAEVVRSVCARSNHCVVLNGRFKGGFITRSFGKPNFGIHAIQMELAMRGYLRERPGSISEADWPPPFEPTYAAPLRDILRDILQRCISFAYKQA